MDIQSLNDRQRQAAQATEGAVLVLAGAGSGKTRVLTTRAAYLIEKGVPPYHILAITFTNKAAAEMKERIADLVDDVRDMWVCTFHAMCARLLRIEGESIGYGRNFTIYDAGDSLTVVKEILKELDVAKDFLNPRSAKAMISRAKNAGIAPGRYINVYGDDTAGKMTARVYGKYEDRLIGSNALDFDDLLLKTLKLFKEHGDVLEKYQRRFAYIMVDEYQDTNSVQYDIIRLLAGGHGNLFVVGDDDQSIYGWRGADITNILGFERDFPGARVIRLEQNYRSHQHILNAANGVIRHNKGRMGKELWSDIDAGQKPLEFEARDDMEEAVFIAEKVHSILREGRYNPSDIAVLYRVNSQSRMLENKLKERGVPYVIYGGLSFYERKEIKDIVAYLNLVCNEKADLCFSRAVGVPKRGIGGVTLEKLGAAAYEKGIPLLQACETAGGFLPKKAAATLKGFADMIGGIRQDMKQQTLLQTVESVFIKSGMKKEMQGDDTAEGKMRLLNVEEFLRSVADFERNAQPPVTLEAFLERNALVSDVDTVGDQDDVIMLMTLHSAKGLEFPVVFIVGLQEGLLPHQMSLAEGDVEEERRLCYVGMTRAKKRLYLTWSATRFLRTGESFSIVKSERSRFLGEIPKGCLEQSEVKRTASAHAPAAKSQSPFSLTQGGSGMPSFRPDISKKAEHPPDAFVAGKVVQHPRFGKGKVLSINGEGEEKIAVVKFENGGEKKMFVAFAPLKIL
ncbi:MAG: UvrD-helicase domain-containing protein [Eubacteriales bacterium]|nr:UvrD-helicase domain-containing protein [Eubacteriales bacterium]